MPNYQNQSYRLPGSSAQPQPGINRPMRSNTRPMQNMDSATSVNYAAGGGGGGGNALTGGRPISRSAQPVQNQSFRLPQAQSQPVQNQSFRLPQSQPVQNQSYRLPTQPQQSQQPQQGGGMMYANQGGGLDQAQLYRIMLDRQRQQQGGGGMDSGTWGGQGSPYFNPGDYGVMPGNMGW